MAAALTKLSVSFLDHPPAVCLDLIPLLFIDPMLDTLTAAVRLTAAGFDWAPAKAFVAVLHSSEKVAVSRTELGSARDQLETRLYGALLVQTLIFGGMVVALLKLL